MSLLKSGVAITVLQFLLPPQVSVTVEVDSPPPRSPFTAGCVMTVIPTPHHNGIYCGHLLLHQSSVTLNWTERKAISSHCSLCQSSVALFFLSMAIWLDHPTNESKNYSGDLLPPWLSTGNLLLEGAFFCTKCYKCFIPEMDSALHFNFPADERESYPVEYYFLPLSLLAVTHFLPSL